MASIPERDRLEFDAKMAVVASMKTNTRRQLNNALRAGATSSTLFPHFGMTVGELCTLMALRTR